MKPRDLGVAAAVAIAVMIVAVTAHPQRSPETPRVSKVSDWTTALAGVDTALGAGDIAGAQVAWENAFMQAISSGTWEALLEVGRANLRMAAASGVSKDYEARARENFLQALFRARAQKSVHGALHAATAFADLGDHEVVATALRMARDLAVGEGQLAMLARVEEAEQRLMARAREARQRRDDLK